MNREPTVRQCERRQEVRYPVILDAEVLVPDLDPQDLTLSSTAVIVSLSQHGARIHIQTPEQEGNLARARTSRLCSILCRLPGIWEPSFLSGIIAWMDWRADPRWSHIHIGVRLTEAVSTDRTQLEQFLNRLAGKGDEGDGAGSPAIGMWESEIKRRSGDDRRSGEDRRQRVVAIAFERRCGSDLRSIGERRKSVAQA